MRSRNFQHLPTFICIAHHCTRLTTLERTSPAAHGATWESCSESTESIRSILRSILTSILPTCWDRKIWGSCEDGIKSTRNNDRKERDSSTFLSARPSFKTFYSAFYCRDCDTTRAKHNLSDKTTMRKRIVIGGGMKGAKKFFASTSLWNAAGTVVMVAMSSASLARLLRPVEAQEIKTEQSTQSSPMAENWPKSDCAMTKPEDIAVKSFSWTPQLPLLSSAHVIVPSVPSERTATQKYLGVGCFCFDRVVKNYGRTCASAQNWK